MNNDLAPWLDYEGNRIYVGDIMRHPDGDEFAVVRVPGFSSPMDEWRAIYNQKGVVTALRLCLQIGDKGQAVIKNRSNVLTLEDTVALANAALEEIGKIHQRLNKMIEDLTAQANS